jgi:hypothetical protein
MESENGELRLSKSAVYVLAGIELQATDANNGFTERASSNLSRGAGVLQFRSISSCNMGSAQIARLRPPATMPLSDGRAGVPQGLSNRPAGLSKAPTAGSG